MAHGVMVFTSIASALAAGFSIYDKNAEGYLCRTMTASGWAMALIKIN